jgi:peptide/nickel transport system permease protein
MQAYIIRRLLLIIPTAIFISMIVFLVIRLIPGNVIDLMVQESEMFTKVDRAKLERELGLDAPIYTQYIRWVGDIVLHGDVGKSLWTQEKVTDELLRRLPVTLELAVLALLISLSISIPIGIYSAIRQDTMGDYIARSFAISLIAVPSFWVGTLIIVFSSLWWGWSPQIAYVRLTDNPIANLKIMILPAAVLGMLLSGTVMRMTRTTMLEVLREDYIRTAWAKGLEEKVTVRRHALKNALIPVVTIIGLQVAVLMGGSVIIEQIFSLPGLGRLLVESVSSRDYPMVSGIVLFIGFLMLLINLIVDLSYAFLNPKIRYS